MAPAKANPPQSTSPARPRSAPVSVRRAVRGPAPTPPPPRPAFGRARARALVPLVAITPAVFVVGGAALAASGVLAAAGTAIGAAAAAVGLAVALGNLRYGSSVRLLRSLGGRRADPAREARLVNLTEGLCLGFGLATPQLVVVDDPAPNALSLGRSARSSSLVVTTGALELFDRMQLEAVLAHELAHLKRGDTAAAASAMRAFGLAAFLVPGAARLAQRGVAPDREARADLAAISVTRFPPALADALEALADAPTVQPRRLTPIAARLTGWQWCAPFFRRTPEGLRTGELDLSLRIAALREL